jgi:hypothetical protein
MSMTVRIALEGLEEVTYLAEALDEMGIPFVRRSGGAGECGGVRLGCAWIDGRAVQVEREPGRGIVFKGDSEWRRFQQRTFQNQVRQRYSIAAVRHKIDEMGYQVGEVETLQDGTVKIVARTWR